MQVISYTHEGLVLLLKELGVQLSKPLMNLLAWLMFSLLEKTAAHLFRLAEKLPLVQNASTLVLVVDRTEWIRRGQPVNVLDVALYYKGRALPLFWLVFNRRGNMGDLSCRKHPTSEAERIHKQGSRHSQSL